MNTSAHFNWIALLFAMALFVSTSAQNSRVNAYTFGEGLSLTGKSGYTMSLRGYIQPNYEAKIYTDDSYSGEGAINRFRLRRFRLRLTGDSPNQKVEYRLQVDFSGTSETGEEDSDILFDAWIGYQLTRNIKIKFGQMATPTDNRELRMGSQTLQLVERSRVTSAFASIREFGIFAEGRFRTGGGTYLKPYFTLTNGDGVNVYTADHGGLKVGGRLDFLPFGLFTNYGQFRQADLVRELSPKLVVGGYYNHNNGMSSRRGRNSGAILYLDEDGNESLPNYSKFGVDFMFKYRGFSMLGEFAASTATVPGDIAQRIRNNGTIATSFDVDGMRDVENYVKGRMMLGKGYNIQMGYVFKNLISIDARYAHLDADRHSFLNNGTFYNRPNYYTLGATKYFSRGYGFKVQASVTYVELGEGSNDITSTPIEGNEWIIRTIATFSF